LKPGEKKYYISVVLGDDIFTTVAPLLYSAGAKIAPKVLDYIW
jgi:hypothetical protein